MSEFHPHSDGHSRTGSKIIHIVRRVRTRPDPLSRLEVLRRPPDLALNTFGDPAATGEAQVNGLSDGSPTTTAASGPRASGTGRSANAVGKQIQPRVEPALKSRGSSTPELLRYNAGTDGDARWTPDLGIDESGRVGRHRSAETPSSEDVPDDETRVIGNVDVIRTPAVVGQQGRPSSRRADRSVTGGWVPGVSERLRRDGLDRVGND